MPRKSQVSLSPNEWQAIRIAYSSDPSRPTLQALADQYNVSLSLLSKRQANEKWPRHDSLARETIKRVTQARNEVVAKTVAQVTESLSQHVTQTLQPWLEREKVRHVRSQVKRARKAFQRLDTLTSTDVPFSPKDESFISKSVDTWDLIARRTLGLGEGNTPTSSLTLNVLTDHAAVQAKVTNEKQVTNET